MAKFTDAANQAAIGSRINGINEKFQYIDDDLWKQLDGYVSGLMDDRAGVKSDALFDSNDLAELDAIVIAKVTDLLKRLKDKLNSTVTLKDKIAIQVDGNEVA